jgi:hypothetical protein
MDFIIFFQIWDYSDFHFDLELSNRFTNLIGGLLVLLIVNVVQKFEQVWLDIFCGIVV